MCDFIVSESPSQSTSYTLPTIPLTIPFVNFFRPFSYAAPNLFVRILTLSPNSIILALLCSPSSRVLRTFLLIIFLSGDSGTAFSESVRCHWMWLDRSWSTMFAESTSPILGFLFRLRHPFLCASLPSSSSSLFRALRIASARPSSASIFFRFSLTLAISSINRSEFIASTSSTEFSPWTVG